MKRIDREYQTQSMYEVKYLSSLGVRYSFVKVVNGITTYKYIKTKELFEALKNYYAS